MENPTEQPLQEVESDVLNPDGLPRPATPQTPQPEYPVVDKARQLRQKQAFDAMQSQLG